VAFFFVAVEGIRTRQVAGGDRSAARSAARRRANPISVPVKSVPSERVKYAALARSM
jgi:hypothetical protein